MSVAAATLAEPPGLIASAQRALRVLEVVAAAGDGIAAKAVARRAGYTLGTTYHLLNTLVHEGYLVSLGHGRGFGLGWKIGGLFSRLRETVDAGDEVRAALRELHRRTGAAVYFAVFRAGRAVVAEAVGPAAVRTGEFDRGLHEASHATAFGKVMLAALRRDERRAHLAAAGLLSSDRLEQELAQVARTGLAHEVGEFRADLACVAAPVRGPDGRVVGAVALSEPTPLFTIRRTDLQNAVRAGATRVSAVLETS
ncbi:IclR family transcriptional regulator [Pseudonocardia sp. N23]|uniref:IclR family transcriptional regulator n=1 Tax=Pseudonocardia sp. N23 TaxID=1987376 RepID=UPI000BFBD1C8|nr:IclR family transcriptional regulator C-terminal domain-containing protein [Pseudonocardia sp. N23]GAY08067.1 transcriptional regulator, IclR family [Pseudonocardia sp. N23]